VASVRRCIDCDVVLSDDPAVVATTDDGTVAGDGLADGGGGMPVGEGDRVGYELEGWGNQLKVSLEGMLDQAGIRRVWEAGALVVSADDETAVDALIATIEGGDVADLADVDEQVAFEIEDLDADTAAELDAQLIARGLAHAWSDEGDLLVAAADEDEVSLLIDALFEALADDDRGVGDGDGLAANEALSDLFLVLDRLVPAPHDAKLADRLATVAATVGGLSVPYGFGAGDWTALHEDLAALRALIDADPTDEVDGDEPTAEPTADPTDEVDGEVDGDDVLTWADRISLAAEELRDRVHGWI
jgi:hypothetical protein